MANCTTSAMELLTVNYESSTVALQATRKALKKVFRDPALVYMLPLMFILFAVSTSLAKQIRNVRMKTASGVSICSSNFVQASKDSCIDRHSFQTTRERVVNATWHFETFFRFSFVPFYQNPHIQPIGLLHQCPT